MMKKWYVYHTNLPPPPPPTYSTQTKQKDARAVVLFDLLSAQRLDDPSLRPDPDTCKAVLRPLARAGRLDDGLALVEEVLASPQGAYVSRYPLALFVLHAVRVGQGPRVAGRLAGMLEVRMV